MLIAGPGVLLQCTKVLDFGFSRLMKNHFMPVWGFLLRYKRPCRTLYKRLPFPKRLRYASGMLQNSLTKLLGVQIILMFVATPPVEAAACHLATVA